MNLGERLTYSFLQRDWPRDFPIAWTALRISMIFEITTQRERQALVMGSMIWSFFYRRVYLQPLVCNLLPKFKIVLLFEKLDPSSIKACFCEFSPLAAFYVPLRSTTTTNDIVLSTYPAPFILNWNNCSISQAERTVSEIG